jgi:hypothetical protein
MITVDTDEIVGRFVRDGHLVAMPAREAKRRLVLEHIAQSFEPGVYYPEHEVNAILRAWTDGGASDHATLRRYLVDHGLLARGHGRYWRSGGWIDVFDD